MKNLKVLENKIKLTSKIPDFIPVSEVGSEFNVLIVSSENGGLAHLYVKSKKVFRLCDSEYLRSWEMIGNKVLQLNFPYFKALCGITDDGEFKWLGTSFVSVTDYSYKNSLYLLVKELVPPPKTPKKRLVLHSGCQMIKSKQVWLVIESY